MEYLLRFGKDNRGDKLSKEANLQIESLQLGTHHQSCTSRGRRKLKTIEFISYGRHFIWLVLFSLYRTTLREHSCFQQYSFLINNPRINIPNPINPTILFPLFTPKIKYSSIPKRIIRYGELSPKSINSQIYLEWPK